MFFEVVIITLLIARALLEYRNRFLYSTIFLSFCAIQSSFSFQCRIMVYDLYFKEKDYLSEKERESPERRGRENTVKEEGKF